jgi:hypothetical protein
VWTAFTSAAAFVEGNAGGAGLSARWIEVDGEGLVLVLRFITPQDTQCHPRIWLQYHVTVHGTTLPGFTLRPID